MVLEIRSAALQFDDHPPDGRLLVGWTEVVDEAQ